jgi:Spy/CpxP family protein refolding chaperone
MKTKQIVMALLAAAAWLTAGTVAAQTERDVIEVMRAQVATNRQALVAENMNLTETEADAFWPLYREFQNERANLADRRVAMLTEFRDNFDSLSEERAKEIINDHVKLEDDFLRLRKRYLPKFRKVLGEKQTMRYLQIENKLEAIIDFELARVVPLAE